MKPKHRVKYTTNLDPKNLEYLIAEAGRRQAQTGQQTSPADILNEAIERARGPA
jgi:hypothetical protein